MGWHFGMGWRFGMGWHFGLGWHIGMRCHIGMGWHIGMRCHIGMGWHFGMARTPAHPIEVRAGTWFPHRDRPTPLPQGNAPSGRADGA